MRIKEITKNSILFDNGNTLTYTIENNLKYNLYSFVIDFLGLSKKIYEYDFNEEKLRFLKSCVYFNHLSDDEMYEDEIHYTYNPDTSEFNVLLSSDIRNIGFILENEVIFPGTHKFYKEFFVPIYRFKNTITNDQMNELEKQINEIQKESKKYVNTKYTLEEKILGEVVIKFFYNDKEIIKFNGIDSMELPGNYIHSDNAINYDKSKSFKINQITEDYIEFSNGKKLTFNHEQDCCEINYADFTQIDDIALDTIFYENEFVFEVVENCGIRFGNRGGNMVFVPCYSDQNGYYSTSLDIYYDGKLVLHLHESEFQYYGIPNKK